MRNPFIVLRGVCLAVLLYLSIVDFGFAIWNITATNSVGLPVSGASIFVIVNASLLYFCLGVSLAELFVPSRWAPQVMSECAWTAVAAVLQIVCATVVTIDGPPVQCLSRTYSSACASSTLLVAITWVSGSILLMYFCFLVSTAIAHKQVYPAVWGSTVCSVPWYIELQRSGQDPEAHHENAIHSERDVPVASSSALPQTAQTEKPPSVGQPHTPEDRPHAVLLPEKRASDGTRPQWAKSIKTRRGVDPPFAVPSARPLAKLRSYWSTSSPSTPLPPPVHARGSSGSQYVELPVIMHSPSRPISYGLFPDCVADPDAPIRKHSMSGWITADNSPRSERRSPPRTPPRTSS